MDRGRDRGVPRALALPLIEPLLAGARSRSAPSSATASWSPTRASGFLRQSFALYLAPAVIDKMMASNKPPALGGEMRNVTVYFSDIADFSSIAGEDLARRAGAAMNEYLSAMTDIIEAHGGFVDKYIGDAIVAVFGAPLDDPDHAAQRGARRAALRGAARRARPVARRVPGRALRQRIGLNSGEALVGNIGSRRRFNYTVMGDTVNLASRLEGANKFFGTAILASEMTMAAAGDAFAWRELDAIRVKGRASRSRSTSRWRPAPAAATRRAGAQAYAEGLERFRPATLPAPPALSRAGGDPPAMMFHAARQGARQPPGADWEPINALDEK